MKPKKLAHPSPVAAKKKPAEARMQARVDFLVHYGNVLRLLRVRGPEGEGLRPRRWSVAHVARRARVAPAHLRRIEAGAAEPGMLLALRLAAALGTTVHQILEAAADIGDLPFASHKDQLRVQAKKEMALEDVLEEIFS